MVVWILGAGFSRSLGGPLLDDLLQPDCLRRLGATFPRDEFPLLHGALPEAVIWLFHYGRRFSAGRRSSRVWEALGESLWRDAEEFLDFIDSAAAEKGPARATLGALLHHHREDLFGNGASIPQASEVRAMARRLIGAECTAFLRHADLGTERWGPYLRWARELVRSGDVIVTFNYDLVPEHLCAVTDQIAIQMPKGPGLPGVPVLKLHGSVNWCRTATEQYEAVESSWSCRCDPWQLAMATPGRTKAAHAKEFVDLWERATQALSTADSVVFLGYRFPPSDAEARTRILDALRGRPKIVHTVLGPDVRSPDSARLRGLLEHAGMIIIHQQPLYVEDFLSVVARKALTGLPELPLPARSPTPGSAPPASGRG